MVDVPWCCTLHHVGTCSFTLVGMGHRSLSKWVRSGPFVWKRYRRYDYHVHLGASLLVITGRVFVRIDIDIGMELISVLFPNVAPMMNFTTARPSITYIQPPLFSERSPILPEFICLEVSEIDLFLLVLLYPRLGVSKGFGVQHLFPLYFLQLPPGS